MARQAVLAGLLGATHVRTVRISGSIRRRWRKPFVSEVLNGERIGIVDIADDEHEVRFGPMLLDYIKRTEAHPRPGKRRRHSPENCHPTARSETSSRRDGIRAEARLPAPLRISESCSEWRESDIRAWLQNPKLYSVHDCAGVADKDGQ